MEYILGIDVGTTLIKTVIFDHASCIKGMGSCELPLIYPKPGWVEQDPNIMWQSIIVSVKEAFYNAKISKNKICCIGVAHQGESVMVWESTNGEPLYNNIVWQDRRTADRCDTLIKQIDLCAEVTKKTGLFIDPYFSSTKIEWLFENVLIVRNKLKNKIMVGTIDSWLIWKLTGGKSFFTDYTSASRTMLFNIDEMQWDEDLLKFFSLSKSNLAEPVPSSFHYGMTDPDMFFGIKVPITGAVVDTQGALFGQACFNKGDIKSTYGTSCMIMLNTGSDRIVLEDKVITTVAIGLHDVINYAAEGSIYVAGAAIQWLRDGLELISKADDSDEMAGKVDNTMGVYFVPAFVGLATPYWDYRTRGTIVGLTRGVRKEHIVRATLESIAYQVKDVVESLVDKTGISVSELKVDGGAVKNTFLMQFQADILRIPVIVPNVTETTCLGASYLAGLQIGYWRDLTEIEQNWKINKMYIPSMSESEVENRYENWSRAVNKVIDLYK